MYKNNVYTRKCGLADDRFPNNGGNNNNNNIVNNR